MIHRLPLATFLLAAGLTFGQVVIAQQPTPNNPLPLSRTPSSGYMLEPRPMSIPQQRAMFEADQRMLRMEWNKWIGYSPLRPNLNASYMSNGMQRYYIPSRGVIISAGNAYQWYW